MYYLARNKEVVAEARELFYPRRGIKVGDTSSAGISFATLGSFPSAVLGREIFLGIKEYRNYISNILRIEQRALLELATIATIAEHIIDIRDDLPGFYALLRGAEDRPIGILMEDFSEDGRLRVTSEDFIPKKIISLFGEDILDEGSVHHTGFYVEGRVRYGDFYYFFKHNRREEALARLPMSQALQQVTRDMWQHTFRLGRDL